MAVRLHDRHFVGQSSQTGNRPPKSDTRNRRRHLARNTANFSRRCHFWIERLKLRRATLEIQDHDRLAAQELRGLGGTSIYRHSEYRQTTRRGGTSLQELAPATV